MTQRNLHTKQIGRVEMIPYIRASRSACNFTRAQKETKTRQQRQLEYLQEGAKLPMYNTKPRHFFLHYVQLLIILPHMSSEKLRVGQAHPEYAPLSSEHKHFEAYI